MHILKKALKYFTPFEIALWTCSVVLIAAAFAMFDKENFLTLAASLIGATSLIFTAKGNALGQILIIVFSALYGAISYTFAYYGEMITYLGMSAPIAILAVVAWLKNPYAGGKAEVKVNRLSAGEHVFMWVLAAGVTAAFYFILEAFDTANLIPSTVSVTTSFVASYLTFRRSPLYALAYAANDIVLIVLWALASAEDITYISVVICFVTFLVNDIYGFVSWSRMRKRQSAGSAARDVYIRIARGGSGAASPDGCAGGAEERER